MKLTTKLLKKLLNRKVIGSTELLLHKWFSLYTLWELNISVESALVNRVITETSDFLKRPGTEAKLTLEMDLMLFFEQSRVLTNRDTHFT
ncbi:MAG: hypothetical protein ACK5V3_04910 [Bdellovibrionales bacterium]